MHLLVADKFEQSGIDGLRALGIEVSYSPNLSGEELKLAIQSTTVDILVVRSTKVTQEMMLSSSLSLIIRAGAGYDNIDVKNADLNGIKVANCPGKNSIAVAELTMALILAIDRHIPDNVESLRQGKWDKKQFSKARGLYGRQLGIVGSGKIAQEVALRAKAFGMKINIFSHWMSEDDAIKYGATLVPNLQSIATNSDIVSIHTSLTENTKKLIDHAFFSLMKENSYFINTSRAEVVDQEALEAVLKSGKIFAGLDVFDGELSSDLGVAYAYTTDVLPENERSKGIGAVGAALGLGFIMGAPLGGLLVKAGHGTPYLVSYTAVLFAIINWIYVYFLLPESFKKEEVKTVTHWYPSFTSLINVLRLPNIGFLLFLYFAACFAVSNLESTFIQFMYFNLYITEEQAGFVFAYVGLLGAMMQGYSGKLLIPKLTEIKTIKLGYILQAPMLAAIPFSTPWITFLTAISIYAVGRGIADPAVNTLISKSAPSEIQGRIFGITQSIGALARIASPLVANSLFKLNPTYPYILAALLLLIPFLGIKRIHSPVFKIQTS